MGTLNGFSLDCSTGNKGGTLAVKIIPFQSITGWTDDAGTSGGYSAFTKAVGEAWENYDFDPEQDIEFTEKENGLPKARTWAQDLGLCLGPMSDGARTAIMEFSDCACGVIVAVQFANGRIIIYGDDKLAKCYAKGNDATSGKNYSTESTEMIHLAVDKARYKAKPYTGTWDSLV